MISEAAVNSLDRLFRDNVSRHIRDLSARECHLDIVVDETEMKEREFALITLSSSVFKCLGIFHFNPAEKARHWFGRLLSTPLDRFDETAFRDAFLEFCNMCCGSLNRDLIAHFPHLGMSTPYFLQRDCLPFIQELDPGFSRHYRIALEPDLILHVSLYLCDFGPVDFTARYTDAVEDTGELELF